MKRTKAAVLEATGGSLRLAELEIAEPGANEIAIRVVACGLCHSDYSCIHGIVRVPLPVVLGHEAGGVVEAVGPGVTHLKAGDHVIVSLTPACGRCEFCVEEKPFLCSQMFATLGNCTMPDGTTRLSLGVTGVHQLGGIGGFAERAVVPAGCAVRVDADLPLDTICLIGCGVTTGVGAALNTAGVRPGTTVAVLGCGGVGLSVVQGARIAGAKTIVAVDPVPARRELAMTLGATHAVDPRGEESTRAVKKIVPGGVHYAFEVIGRPDTMAQAFAMVRPSGLAIVVGVTAPSDSVPIRAGGFQQQKAIVGSAYGSAVPRRDFPRFVDLYRKGELRLEPMITARIALEEVNEALAAMTRGEGARSVIQFGLTVGS
jgi:S-(hydroxymethyl)glutathione dehydrogenase/alcohol dehydrogenase